MSVKTIEKIDLLIKKIDGVKELLLMKKLKVKTNQAIAILEKISKNYNNLKFEIETYSDSENYCTVTLYCHAKETDDLIYRVCVSFSVEEDFIISGYTKGNFENYAFLDAHFLNIEEIALDDNSIILVQNKLFEINEIAANIKEINTAKSTVIEILNSLAPCKIYKISTEILSAYMLLRNVDFYFLKDSITIHPHASHEKPNKIHIHPLSDLSKEFIEYSIESLLLPGCKINYSRK